VPPAEWLQSLTYGERAVAYLHVDTELTLIGAGGHLANYGLATVRLGEPAVEQAYFLEGLLPLIETPYFVPSVELAGGRAVEETIHVHRCSGGCGGLSVRGGIPARVQEPHGLDSGPVAESAGGIQRRSLRNAPVFTERKLVNAGGPPVGLLR
jgi:hypothetical protein